MFYALMPADNPATVAADDFVEFPQTFGFNSPGIVRADAGNFILVANGTYEIFFQVSVDEPGQLQVYTGTTLGGQTGDPITVVGRATGTSQIVGHTYIHTTTPNSFVSIRNPSGNTPALTITPLAGGTHAVSANLLIRRLA